MKRKVLIIDDQPHLGRILRMMLEYSGYEVHQAAQMVQIAESVRSFQPDVVILDLNMPEKCGSQVASELIDICGIPAERIIFFSGLISPDAPRVKQTPAGPMRFVSKTAPPREILDAVKKALSARDVRPSLAA